MTSGVDAVRMQGIAKRFGSVQALRGADFALAPGEVHALLGENGAGKTTLMRVLFGLVVPESGSVHVHGHPLPFGSPRAAMAAGLGMVHQHYSQVPVMTVAENVWLGRPGLTFDRAAAAGAIRRVGADTGLALDPAARAEDLPSGLRQRLEIVKALARDARVLLLDEPTSSLTPGEVDELFAALRRLVTGGLSIVLITHRMREVLAVADRVTVLRRGEVVHTGRAADATAATLATAMIGDRAPPAALAAVMGAAASEPAPAPRRTDSALVVRDVVTGGSGRQPVVPGISLEVRAHEIVAIAAVEGNGQRELLRAVAGLQPYRGSIEVGHGGTAGFIPEDRHHEGLILDFSVVENIALGGRHAFWMDRGFLEHQAALAVDGFGIRTPDARLPVRTLSGGNQQKVVLARELARQPALLVAENPTRGLDIQATAEVHERLRRAARDDGLGVLFYSTDLDEVLAVGDRIGVMVRGRWHWVAAEERSRERVGALMLGSAA